jgi:hypothetical protein
MAMIFGRLGTIQSWALSMLLLALLAGSSLVYADAAVAGEYDMKAAYLFNFAKFINWPEGSFVQEDQPIQICVLGRDDFGGALERVSRGRGVQGREVEVKKLMGGGGDDAKARSCNILFVSCSEAGREMELLSALMGQPIVTVGEVDGFTEYGGVFNYISEGTRIRFELNRKAAEANGLSVSSRLVRLAQITN